MATDKHEVANSELARILAANVGADITIEIIAPGTSGEFATESYDGNIGYGKIVDVEELPALRDGFPDEVIIRVNLQESWKI